MSLAMAGCALLWQPALAKVEFSEAEAQEACTQLAPKSAAEAIFDRVEVHRDTMGGLGFVCKIFLEGKTGDQNIGLSVQVSGMSPSVQRFKRGERIVNGPSTTVDGVGEQAVATVEYQGDRVRGLTIEGVRGAYYFQLWIEPEEMSDALYQQCVKFLRSFVDKLTSD